MTIEALLIDAEQLTLPWDGPARPLGVIDLEQVYADCPPLFLPPFPLIGFGREGCAVAQQLDMSTPDRPTLLNSIATISRAPQASALLVQLLRLIEDLPVDRALVAESWAYGLTQGGAEHQEWLAMRRASPAQPVGEVVLVRCDNQLEITLNRPNSHNAINTTLRDGLRAGFQLAALDPSISEIHLTGTGRCFSLGADFSEFGTTRDPLRAHAIRMETLPAHAIARVADRLTVHVQGGCVGAGLEMAAFAARLTARADAWFQLPELAMGIIPGAGGCVSLSRRLGRQGAAELILSARRINARAALGIGLIDAIVDD